MLPRFQNLPFDNSGVPDKRFANGVGQVNGSGTLGEKYYEVAAFGQPVHGLNVGGVVVNKTDFPTPISYALSFRKPSQDTEKAWTGEVWTSIPKYNKVPQIDGFRCGDVNLLRVPGFNSARKDDPDTAAYDASNKLSWKNYALISGRDKFAFCKTLGKNSWLCSFGVGRTFRIEFLSSVAPPNSSRRFQFRITQYGVFGKPVAIQDVTYDSGVKDYASATGEDILTSIINQNLRRTEAWRLEDFSSTGQKALIAGYYHYTTSEGFEDDGVNDATTSPVVWLEFTFTNPYGNNLVVKHRVVRNFTQLPSDSYNIMHTLTVPAVGAGPLGKKHVPGMRLSYSTTAKPEYPKDGLTIRTTQTAWRVVDYEADGASTVEQKGLPNNWGSNYGSITPKPGYWEGDLRSFTSITRVVHICYGLNDALVESKSKFESISSNITQTIAATFTGSVNSRILLVPEIGTTRVEGSGSMTMTIVKDKYFYRRTYFGLLVNNVEVAAFSTEIGGDRTRMTTTTVIGWDGKATSSVTDEAQPESYVSAPPLSVSDIRPAIGMGISNMNSRLTTTFFISASVGLEEPGWKVWPFIRVESNKIVSFNIGRAGYSMGVDEQGGGANSQFPIRYPVLASGNHFERTVWNSYLNAKMTNSDAAYGNGANPALEIPGGEFYCTFNPGTGQSVLNAGGPCTWV